MIIGDGQINLLYAPLFDSTEVGEITWVALLKGYINTQDLTIPAFVYTDTYQYRAGYYLMIYSYIEVEGIWSSPDNPDTKLRYFL